MKATSQNYVATAIELMQLTFDSLGRSFITYLMALACTICVAEVITSLIVVVGRFGIGILHDDQDCWWALFATGVPIALLFQPGLITLATRSTVGLGCSIADLFSEFRSVPRYLFGTFLYFLAVSLSLLFFVIPGVVVASLLSLYGFVIIEERVDALTALKRSVQLARPYLYLMIPVQILLAGIGYILLEWHFYLVQFVMMLWFVFTAEIYNRAINTQSQSSPVHDVLHNIRASACDVNWNSMQGADQRRRCVECGFDVLKSDNVSAESLNESFGSGVTSNEETRFWRRSDGTFMANECKRAQRFSSKRGALILFAAGFSPLVADFILAPSYILPYINHPAGRVVTMALLLWHILGCFLFSLTKGKRFSNSLFRLAIIVFFTMPFVLCALLGPATIAILDAFVYNMR